MGKKDKRKKITDHLILELDTLTHQKLTSGGNKYMGGLRLFSVHMAPPPTQTSKEKSGLRLLHVSSFSFLTPPNSSL